MTAEKKYSINFTKSRKTFCLSLHYNGANSYLFVSGTEIITFKAKDFENVVTPLWLRNIWEDFFEDNMKKTGLFGYVYDFSVDYDAIAVDDVLGIHKYLMKKNGIVKMFGFIKKAFVAAMMFFSCNALECVSMNKQDCRARPAVININSNDLLF